MKTKLLLPIVIAAAIVGCAAWKLADNKRTMDAAAARSSTVNTVVPVMVAQPQSISLDQRFSASGRIAAGNELTVYAQTTAVVVRKHKRAGDAVAKGAIVAELENSVLRHDHLLAAQDCAKAQRDVERFSALAAAGAVTTRELEESQSALRNVESRLAALEEQLAQTTIVAPVSGVVDKDFFEPGTLLTLGAPVVAIVDRGALKMELQVTEAEMLRLTCGDRVEVRAGIYPDRRFEATIAVVAPKGNDRYAYSVELHLSNHHDLRPGMFATATFGAEGSENAGLVVNRRAIVGSIKDPYVYVVRDRRAYKTAVVVGQKNAAYVEITQGIAAGDVVVLSGHLNLQDGAEVVIVG